MEPEQIGYIVGGSLKENLRVRLTVPANSVQEGAFVVVESGDWLFYGLVTDLQLGSTDPRFADEQSEQRLPAELAALLHGQTLYTNLEVMPALMAERPPDPGDPRYETYWAAHKDERPHPLPVKTIPAHHARVRLAGKGDIAEIFGDPAEKGRLHHRLHPRAGPPGVPGPGKAGAALVGRLWRHRHGQILPHPPAPGRADPLQRGRGADL